MRCPDCGVEMKPLATSVYCPNDCDRKVTEVIDHEKTEPLWPASPAQLSLSLDVDPDVDPDLDWTGTWIDGTD